MPYICLNTFCIILSKKKINIFLYAIGINMYVYRIHKQQVQINQQGFVAR